LNKIILIFFSIQFVALSATNDEAYYNIYSNLNKFGKVYERINNDYVGEVDPNILVKESIIGMLSALDPYTRYEEITKSNRANYLSTGYYIGYGFYLDKMDDGNRIVKLINNSPAEKAGMRVGDLLLTIDSVNVQNMDQESLSKIIDKDKGSESEFRFFRHGVKDTFNVTIKTAEIPVNDIPFFRLIDDTTAYVKLDQFSFKADYAFRKALRDMEYESKFDRLIIDLRDNPGGVMQAALRILELFVEENTLLLTTRGKSSSDIDEYFSKSKPLYPDLKIAVLINGGSASASEIIAGALQDTDRGVVIGKKSFGKGLVQHSINLDEESKINITVAKYYTPSGRSIQKLDYNISDNKYDIDIERVADFKTINGRKVNTHDGINPDVTVRDKDYSEIVNNLIKSDYIFNFAVGYASNYDKSSESYTFEEEGFEDFLSFLDSNKRLYDLEPLNLISRLERKKNEKIQSDITKENILLLENSLKNDLRQTLVENKEEIISLINDIIVYILKGREKSFFKDITDDKYIISATETLNKNYNKILKLSNK